MSSPIDRLKQTFAAACDQHSIQGRLAGSPGALEVTFTAQEGANEAMMLHGFGEELRSDGVDWAEMAADAGPDEATLTRYEAGVRAAVGRMRVLLVELNSYITGGLDWVFPAAPEALSGRGLANYRFPARAAAALRARSFRAASSAFRQARSASFWTIWDRSSISSARSSTSATTRPRTSSGRRATASRISFTFSATMAPP